MKKRLRKKKLKQFKAFMLKYERFFIESLEREMNRPPLWAALLQVRPTTRRGA